jgi:hypothetical protein
MYFKLSITFTLYSSYSACIADQMRLFPPNNGAPLLLGLITVLVNRHRDDLLRNWSTAFVRWNL